MGRTGAAGYGDGSDGVLIRQADYRPSQQTGAEVHRGSRRFGGGHLLCSPRVRRDHYRCFVVVVPAKTLVPLSL